MVRRTKSGAMCEQQWYIFVLTSPDDTLMAALLPVRFDFCLWPPEKQVISWMPKLLQIDRRHLSSEHLAC